MQYLQLLWENLMSGFENTGITTSRIIVSLLLAFVIGIYIFYVYRAASKDGFYSRSYGIALGIIAPIMSGMVLTMQSSLIISLSSIGALSIIRFRTPIKDPLDLLFLFWSIGTGIMCGTGVYEIAIISLFIISIGVLVFSILPVKRSPYLLVINGDDYSKEKDILGVITANTKHYHVKSRNLTNMGFDMVIEVKTKDESGLLTALKDVDGITSLSLVEHDGELRG